MSATVEPRQEHQVDPATAFERYVWFNPEVCTNCFARCRIVYEDVPDRGLSARPRSTAYRTENAVSGHDGTDHDEYGAIQTFEPATTCGNCGSVRLLNQHDIMSASEMIDTVDALVERLAEQGIEADAEAMKRLIGRVKAKSTAQGYDREIFEHAVAFGIRWARRQS